MLSFSLNINPGTMERFLSRVLIHCDKDSTVHKDKSGVTLYGLKVSHYEYRNGFSLEENKGILVVCTWQLCVLAKIIPRQKNKIKFRDTLHLCKKKV